MNIAASDRSDESTDDGYGEAISLILFGQAPWYTRYGAGLIAGVFAIAFFASWLISYPSVSRTPVSLQVNDEMIVGKARVPKSFIAGLGATQTVAVTLSTPDLDAWLPMNATIRSIAQATQDGKATVELVFPREFSDANLSTLDRSWTVDIRKDERLFEIMLR